MEKGRKSKEVEEQEKDKNAKRLQLFGKKRTSNRIMNRKI